MPFPFGPLTSLAENPPVPLLATWAGGPEPVYVTFDSALATGPSGTGPWSSRLAMESQTIVSVVSEGGVATVSRVPLVEDPGPDFVAYSAVPQTLFGRNGLPVGAFSLPVV